MSTPDDSSDSIPRRELLGLIKPEKKISEMTDEERHALAERIFAIAAKNKPPDPR